MNTVFQRSYNEKLVYPVGFPEIENEKNIILTQHGRMGYGCLGNNNVLAIGPAEYLTKSIAVPNILQGYGSYIVLDPDGTIYKNTKDFLEENGYTIKIVDLAHPETSEAYNPFRFLHCKEAEKRYERVLLMARSIVNATKTEEKSDLFWMAAEEALLQAVIFYLLDHCEPEEQNLPTMAKLLETAVHGQNDAGKLLDPIFEKIREGNPEDVSAMHYAVFRQAAAKTARMICTLVAEYMSGFTNPGIRQIIDHDSLRMQKCGDTKTAVFLNIPNTTDTERILTNIILGQAFPVLRERAEKKCQIPLKTPVHFILNACTAAGEIPKLHFAQIVMHNYGVSCILMLRSIDQLRQCYGNQWNQIADACYAAVYFRGEGDAELYERESRIYGRKAISGFQFVSDRIGITVGEDRIKRPLFTPEAIKRIALGHAVCMVAGQDPVDDTAYDPETHPSC